jgi:hypothetical protein
MLVQLARAGRRDGCRDKGKIQVRKKLLFVKWNVTGMKLQILEII